MKSYKIKSLIWLCCFIATAVFYYNFEQQLTFENQITNASVVDMEFEDTVEDERQDSEKSGTVND